MLPPLTATIRAWFGRSRFEREMREEMEAHLEQSIDRLMTRGMSREDAEREALREFGHVTRIQEEARDARGAIWLETTLADARFALRQFRRRPIAAATIVLLLGLGLGVNNTVFAALYSYATMPPLGVPRDPSLVRIRHGNEAPRPTLDDVEEYANLSDVFSDLMVSVRSSDVTIRPGGSADVRLQAVGNYVSRNYFEALGMEPTLGRFFDPESSGGGSGIPVVIDYELWQTHFGGTPRVIGQPMRVNEVFLTVIGVAPATFQQWYVNPSVWIPLDAAEVVDPNGVEGVTRSGAVLLVARLRAGVTREAAQAAVEVVWERSPAASVRRNTSLPPFPPPDVVPLLSHNEYPTVNDDAVFGGGTAVLASLLFLLATCTNVSALLVGLSVARRREVAVRVSLGAGRRRLVRQLLTESVILAVAGGVLGVAFLVVTLRILADFFPHELVLAWPVVLFTFGLALSTGVLTGLLPAFQVTRVAPQTVLKDAGPAVSHSRSRAHPALIVAQVALTQPLLVGLGATLIVSFSSLGPQRQMAEERVVTIAFGSGGLRRETDDETTAARSQRALELEEARRSLAELPGVVDAIRHSSVGMLLRSPRVHPADQVPGLGSDGAVPVSIAERVSGGWLGIMGIPLVSGRDFNRERMDEDSASVIIGSEMAEQLWGGVSPIGRRILVDDGERQLVVIGTYDEEIAGRSSRGESRFFVASPADPRLVGILVRTRGPAGPMLPSLRQVIAKAAPNAPISTITVLSAERGEVRREMLMIASAAGAGGLTALLLSAIGLYALVSLTVAERRRDIGIRGALGGGRLAIIRPYAARGVKLGVMGVLLGLPISLVAVQILNRLADRSVVHVPLVAAVVAGSVFAVICLATLIPASRAARVMPMEILRDAG